MNDEITSSAMQCLLGVNNVALNDLAKRGVVIRARNAAAMRGRPRRAPFLR